MNQTPITAKVQMCARYPMELVQDAHTYALEHELSLNVLLSAALAEYLAKREQGDGDPTPQLHYRRGHPSASAVKRQEELMKVDHRGRKLRGWSHSERPRSGRRPFADAAAAHPLADHERDGRAGRRASEDPAQVRESEAHLRRVPHSARTPVPLAR
jgi:hypothetical protein